MRKWIKLVENDIISDDEEDGFEAQESAEDARVAAVEKAIAKMCATEFGWEFDGLSYPINYDASDNEITIKVQDEITLAQLQKLTILGDEISVSASDSYRMYITIKAHEGLSIPA